VSNDHDPQVSHPGLLWLAFAAFALTWFLGLEFRGLFMPDEGRYASIAREMLESADWITPRLNGLKYFEKPPLQYWATAVAYALFGVDEWTARLWPALTGFLGILFTALAGSRLVPKSPWLPLALVVAGSWGYFLGGQFLTLDMGLTFFLTAAMLSFLLGRREGVSASAERGWMILAWAAAGCAVLSKGVVGVVLPSLALLVYVAIQREWSLLRRLHWGTGLCVFGAIVLPWFVLVQLKNPEFFRFFFIHEHFERFLLTQHHRPGPWWYFVPILLIGLMPWTPNLPASLARAWKTPASSGLNVDRFLLVWAATVVVFFSASQSKLPGYVLPAFPAMLLLFARQFPDMTKRMRSTPAATCLAAGVILMPLSFALPYLGRRFAWPEFDPDYGNWLLAAAATLALAGLAAIGLLRRAREEASLVVVGLGSLLAVQLALSGMHLLDERYSSERPIEFLAQEGFQFPRDLPFYSVGMLDQSVLFYLGRSVTLVGAKDELAPGIAAEPEKYIATAQEFLERWRNHPEAFAIMRPEMYEELKRQGLQGRVLVADRERLIIARR
jgi:4-amino-4-deoxy-L-arabinose transferase-like glycosyltransferase